MKPMPCQIILRGCRKRMIKNKFADVAGKRSEMVNKSQKRSEKVLDFYEKELYNKFIRKVK